MNVYMITTVNEVGYIIHAWSMRQALDGIPADVRKVVRLPRV